MLEIPNTVNRNRNNMTTSIVDPFSSFPFRILAAILFPPFINPFALQETPLPKMTQSIYDELQFIQRDAHRKDPASSLAKT
jgi:hypothetical protein